MFTIADSHRRAQLGRQPHHPDRLRGAHKVVKILRVSARKGARSARINRYFTRGRRVCVMRLPNPRSIGAELAVAKVVA